MQFPTEMIEEVFALVDARPQWPQDEWAFLSFGYMARLHFDNDGNQLVDVYYGSKLVNTWRQVHAEDKSRQVIH